MLLRRRALKRKGQALVEYAILLCGIALISLVAVSLLGHKTAEMLGTIAVFLPAKDADENGPITAGHLIETTKNANGAITVDVSSTTGVTQSTDRLGKNLGTDLSGVVVDP
jgi:hypothetical protein